MGNQREVTGKTVDEAIFKGLKEIGLSIDEVEIEIVQKGSLGLLGIGAKPAIVRLTEKDKEHLDIRGILEGEDTPAPKRYEEKKEAPAKTKEVIRNESHTVEDAQLETEDASEESAIPYSEDLAKTIPAAQFLSGMLDKMGIEGTVLAAETDNTLKINIETEQAGVLIGHRGETLDAIQYLTLLAANRNRGENEYTRVTVDTQKYREKREEVLIRLARSKASAVRATGKPYKFEPMSPYERRVIHSTLQPLNNITTHSEGIEPYRYVVITSTGPARSHRRPPRRQSKSYYSGD